MTHNEQTSMGEADYTAHCNTYSAQFAERTLRILMFGHCHLVHIGPLAKAIKSQLGLATIEVCETVVAPSRALDAISDVANGLSSVYNIARADSTGFFESVFRRLPGTLSQIINGEGQKVLKKIKRREYDIFHLHWPSVQSERLLENLPKNSPLIVSFWGGDVLDGSSVHDHIFQRKAIKRADVVTVRSIELREHLYSKFGRSFATKIRIAKFANNMFSEFAKLNAPNLKDEFRKRYKICDGKMTICIGHCGYPKENHIAVIDALATLGRRNDLPITLLVPLTYGGSAEYHKQVKQALSQCGMPSICFESYMDRDEVWALRCSTDIFISVPDEDAFSGSMCESIIAGAVAIVGDWLPYGGLRRQDVHFKAVETLSELPKAVIEVIQDLKSQRLSVLNTSAGLKSEVDMLTVLPGWLNAYKDALSPLNRK